MNILKQLNLLVSFLLELIMLYLYGYWGYNTGEHPVMSYVLAVLLPGIVIILWGVWAAPKSKHRLKNPLRSVVKLSLFLLAAVLGFNAGQPAWSIWFGAITLLNAGLAFLFRQDY